MLDGLLSQGGSRRGGAARSAWVPPSSQIALLSTLAIHPAHTNRPSEQEDVLVSTQAIMYLRSLLATVGPFNADLRSAFLFTHGARGGRRGHGCDADFDGDDSSSDSEAIISRFAGESSIWARGQDFWKVVGWALNCSALHPQRWQYWKPWLEYMIDVLECDFSERQRLDRESSQRAASPDGDDDSLLRQSLMVTYLDKCSNRMGLRQVFKAILAGGGQTSSLLFSEVFRRETKSASRGGTKRKRADTVLDLENDKFGDYFDDDSPPSSQGSQASPLAKPRVTGRKAAKASTPATAAVNEGYIESIPLRLRLFYQVCSIFA